MKLLLLYSFAIMLKSTLSLTNDNQTDSEPRDDNSLQKIWIANSIIVVFGVVLNSLVLLIFFQERSKLVTSVNAMIMSVFYLFLMDKTLMKSYRMCAVYCMLYSIVVNWRTLSISFGQTFLLIDQETVSIL